MSSIWIVSMVLQWALIALLCAVVLSLIRQLGAVSIELNAIKETGAGAGAMEIYTRLESSRSVTVRDGAPFQFGGERDRAALLVFYSPMCGSCEQLPVALKELSQSPDRTFDVLAVVSVARDKLAEYARQTGLENIPLAAREDFPEDILPKGGVPMGVSISPDGVIAARGQPKNGAHLREMAYAAQHVAEIATNHSRRRHEWGESAPYWDSAQAQK